MSDITALPVIPLNEKSSFEAGDGLSKPTDDAHPANGMASAYSSLTRWESVKTFWFATMLCFFAGVCVLMEGYQGQITGRCSPKRILTCLQAVS